MANRVINKIRIALIQLAVTSNKDNNLKHAMSMISQAAMKSRADSADSITPLVVLPECFNSPYGTQYFSEYAEEIPGKTTQMLSQIAKEEKIYLIGGSIPEKREGKLYNTATVYNPQGEMLLKYSKCHLFDIDIPGKIRFQESEVLSPGNQLGMFEMSGGLKIGLGICYDIRFPELSLLLAQKGCKLLVFPGAFNMTTGPAHWELLQRGRALDNQSYIATCSPARDTKATYTAWGHSSVVDPWGDVIIKAEESETIICTDIDLDRVDSVRQQIPVQTQKRNDIYQLKDC